MAKGIELDEINGGAGDCGEELLSLFRTEYAGSGGEAVAGGGIGRDEGAGDAEGEAQSSGRVDDVGVAFAVQLKGLVKVAGGGDGAVFEME